MCDSSARNPRQIRLDIFVRLQNSHAGRASCLAGGRWDSNLAHQPGPRVTTPFDFVSPSKQQSRAPTRLGHSMAHLSSRSNGDVANGTIDPRLLSLGSGESLPQHLESDERQLSASQNSTHSSSNIPDEQFQRRTSLNSGTLQSIAELPTETVGQSSIVS